MTTATPVVFELIDTNVLTRWPCHVCGGCTEKVQVLAEVPDGNFKGLRICERCIEARDFDAKLKKHAEELEWQAIEVRSLIGRLQVPTFAEWKAACRAHDVSMYGESVVRAFEEAEARGEHVF